MRIAILANADIGLYKFRKELVECLCKNNDVYMILPNGEFIEALEALGCKFIEFNFKRRGTNPIADFKQFCGYVKVLKQIKPDVVLTYTIKPNVYGGMACQLLRIPYIVNVTGLGTAVENPGVVQKITVMLYKLGLRKAQKVFFQNAENRDFMLNHGIVKKNYDLLPGSGVNLDQYAVQPYPNGDTVDFIFIARIMKEKGIEQYIDAAKEIRKKHPETRFHICGFCEQEYAELIYKLVEKNIVIYHGLVSNMIPIYKMAACTVHPTYYPEGLSNVLLESIASGRPIITTNRSGCREVVEDGVNGYVVKQQDSQNLIDKIEKFLKLSLEKRMEMGIAGRKKAEREFDRRIVIKMYLEELKLVRKMLCED